MASRSACQFLVLDLSFQIALALLGRLMVFLLEFGDLAGDVGGLFVAAGCREHDEGGEGNQIGLLHGSWGLSHLRRECFRRIIQKMSQLRSNAGNLENHPRLAGPPAVKSRGGSPAIQAVARSSAAPWPRPADSDSKTRCSGLWNSSIRRPVSGIVAAFAETALLVPAGPPALPLL